MELNNFLDLVFEEAKGDNAINRGFDFDEIWQEIKRMSDLAFKLEEKFDDSELTATDPRVEELLKIE